MEVIILVVSVLLELLLGFGLYRFFEKAGEKGYLAFVPVLNAITMQKIMGKPFYHFFLQLIPILNLYYYVVDVVDFLECYGFTRKRDRILAFLFGPFYFIAKSIKANFVYLGPIELPKRSLGFVIAYLIVTFLVATFPAVLIRAFLFEVYSIPTPSCANTLKVGDRVIASKLHYGTRLPLTPLQVPLTHQKIWGTNIPSYLDWVRLPYFRLPGFSAIQRNDLIIFNFPNDEGYPTDLKTFYIKRCVATPGDTLEVRNSQVFINGSPSENPKRMLYQYYVFTKEALTERFFESHHISDYYPFPEGYVVYAEPKEMKRMEEQPFINQIIMNKQVKGVGELQIFPYVEKWNLDFFGPLWIPKKGTEIVLTPENIARYGSTIERYEGLENVEQRDGKLLVEGKNLGKYTFHQDYYFVMGDSRHNSLDSRFWGFVPEDHIGSKAVKVMHVSERKLALEELE